MSEDQDISALNKARLLEPPPPKSVYDGMKDGQDFWDKYEDLLRAAWEEFGIEDQKLGQFELGFLDPEMLVALKDIKAHPTELNEQKLKALWKEVVPGVYTARIFTPEFVQRFRAEIERLRLSGIPSRRPNSMNRYGMVIDRKVGLYKMMCGMISELLGPLAQTFFPENIGRGDYDKFHAFTVRYKGGEDVKLNLHRDASIGTLNLNLNAPEDWFGGSDLYFYDRKEAYTITKGRYDEIDTLTDEFLADESKKHVVSFESGMALLHLGA